MLRIITYRIINGDQLSLVDAVEVERHRASRWVRKFMRDPHAEFIAVVPHTAAWDWPTYAASARAITH